MKLEERILIHEVKQLFRTQHETQDGFAWLEVLPQPIDNARFNQRYRIIGNQFCVDAQIASIGKIWQYRVRNAADAQLKNRTVFDERSNVCPNRAVEVGDDILFDLAQWT